MTLPVPLAIRVGDQRLTKEVRSVAFRKEALGGVRSITFSLSRPLTKLDGLDPLAKVYVDDGRSATCVAEGRFADSGRSASAEGERWDCVAFGPAQHANDIARPLIYVDKSLDSWKFERIDLAGAGATFEPGAQPIATSGAQGLLASWQDGTAVNTNSLIAIRYPNIYNAGQKVARVAYLFISGITDPNWQFDTVFSTDGNWGASNTGTADGFNALGGSRAQIVVSDFALGRNVIDFRTVWKGGATAVAGATTWGWVQPVVEAIRLTKAGVEITSGYGGGALVHEIVADLLGRMLPDYDGTKATISTGATHFVDQMAYPDGTTAAKVFEDLMGFEPAYRWYTKPAAQTGGKYRFSWDLWPTEVRYEATLDDGGSFPLSTQDIYNMVDVRWRDELGRVRTTTRTLACDILDDNGLTRRTVIDLGSEIGSAANATKAGDAFLIDHNVPKNGGTLNVARPIRDLLEDRLVQPWEIEAGELVRIQGVEAYPNAFNTSTNDGVGVFRIFALDYNSDGNASVLSLDSDPRETEDALVLLLNRLKDGERRS